MPQRTTSPARFGGLIASRGVAIGPAFRYYRDHLIPEQRDLLPSEIPDELNRLTSAIERAQKELLKVHRVAEFKVGTSAAAIFEAQTMILNDEFMLSTIRDRMKNECKSAAFIVEQEFGHHQHLLEQSDNPVMRDRAIDIQDIKERLLRYLLDRSKWLSKLNEPAIIVSEMLTPADAIMLSRGNAIGFAMDGGGLTSHVAILARSLGIPALVAMHSAAQNIQSGDMLILDADRGELLVNPDEDTLAEYREAEAFRATQTAVAARIPASEIATAAMADGHTVHLCMNLEFGGDASITDAEQVSDRARLDDHKKSLGLGLVRTEHFLLLHDDLPTEEEQTALYSDLAKRFAPAPITLRTFDVGGDKVLSGSYREDNPFLGWRGIRVSLDEPEFFLMQLRAMLRASAHGNVKILFPMLTNADELARANEFVAQAKADLQRANDAFNPDVPLGAMIEVPSAALMIHTLAPMVDFFSIGSNDLTQYTLAVDRGNDLVATLFQELHPAVLRLIHSAITAAHNAGRTIGLCGELGSYPLATPILAGLGIDELSVAPAQVHALACRLRLISFADSKAFATRVVEEAATPEDVKRMTLQFLSDRLLIGPFSETDLPTNVGTA